MTRAEKKSSSRRVEAVACRGGSTSKDGEIRVFQNCLGMSKPCAAESLGWKALNVWLRSFGFDLYEWSKTKDFLLFTRPFHAPVLLLTVLYFNYLFTLSVFTPGRG